MTGKEMPEKAEPISEEVIDSMLAALYVSTQANGIPWRMLGLNKMPSQEAITRAAAAMVKE